MTEISVPLSQNFLHEFSVDVGEAEVSSLEAVGELFVVEAEEVEEGGVEVVDVDLAIDHSEAEFVALAVDVTLLEADRGFAVQIVFKFDCFLKGGLSSLKVGWFKAGVLGDSRKHSRANLGAVVKGEDVIGPSFSL